MTRPIEELLSKLTKDPPPGGAEEDLDAILQRLESMNAAGSGGELALRRRCAVARHFDEAMVDAVLRVGLPDADRDQVPYARLVSHRDVERLAGRAGPCRLRDSAQKTYLAQLPEAERMELHRRLAEHCAARGAAWQNERLYHLIIAEPQQAMALLRAAYQEADERFDLAGCHDLLQMLDAATSPELGTLRNDLRAYHEARCLFADEYYRTAQYLQRREVQEAFHTLLAGPDERWICQVQATGGMGKTMALRWLVSRHCVPAPARIPCARLDFDTIDPVLTALQPWRLLYGFAEQLNPQLPDAPLGELLAELHAHASVYEASGGSATEFDELSASVRVRFGAVLREKCGQRPLALILDTYEEILLRQQHLLLHILGYLDKLHDDCPNIRLVLAGRYDLTERLPGFSERFGKALFPLALNPFSAQEGREYLQRCRSLPEGPALEAAVERAEGIPFKLALFADILQQNPRLTAAEIRNYPSVDLLYLIERVIERIPEKSVRWLLRYGVVPRKLSLSFVKQVMAPYLPRVLSGEVQFDDPAQDAEVPAEKRRDLFPRENRAADSLDLHSLWQELEKYASASTWVSRDKDSDTLVFHNEVVNPMRRLLQQHEIFALLHRDAFDHFESRAAVETDPARRGRWLGEAIYHRFQLGPAREAGAYFTAQIKNLAETTPKLCEQVALTVLGTEYRDAEGRPRQRSDGAPLIERETLLEAAYWVTRSILQRPARSGGWADAQKYLDTASALVTELGGAVERDWRVRFALLHSQIEEKRNPKRALKLVKEAQPYTRNPEEAFAVAMRLGDLLSGMRRQEALEHYLRGESLGYGHVRLAQLRELREKRAQLLADFDRFAEARELLAMAISWDLPPEHRTSLEILRASFLSRAGRPSEALAELRALPPGPNLDIRRRLAVAHAYCALGDRENALDFLNPLGNQVRKSVPQSDRDIRLRAMVSELFGQVYCLEIDLAEEIVSPDFIQARRVAGEQALDDLEDASRWWRELDSLEDEGRCVLKMVEVMQRMDRPTRSFEPTVRKVVSRLPAGSDAWLGLQLVEIEFFVGKRPSTESLALTNPFDRLLALSEKLADRPPHLRVQWALCGLRLVTDAAAQKPSFLRVLLDALETIPTAEARLACLAPLGTRPVLPARPILSSKNDRRKLFDLLPSPVPELSDLDRALSRLRLAWILSSQGEHVSAQATQRAAISIMEQSGEPSAQRLLQRWLRWFPIASPLRSAAKILSFAEPAADAEIPENKLIVKVEPGAAPSSCKVSLCSQTFVLTDVLPWEGMNGFFTKPVPLFQVDESSRTRLLQFLERGSEIAVELDIASTELQPLPWECLSVAGKTPLSAHEHVRCLYRVSQRRTSDAPAWADARRPPSVIVLEAAFQEQDFRFQRGIRQSETSEIGNHYRELGFSVEDLPAEVVGRGSMYRPPKLQPHILHICGTFLGGDEVCLDLGLGPKSELSARRLAKWLERPSRHLVVLEVPRSGSGSEAARQLMLRNAFAAELWDDGMGYAILGIGPALDRRSKLRDLLIRSLQDHVAIGALTQRIRGLSVAAALFANNPDWCPIPEDRR